MTDEPTGQVPDNPGTRVPPPILLIVVILAGYCLQQLWALELTNWSGWYVAAWALVGVGASDVAAPIATHRLAARTAVINLIFNLDESICRP